MAEGLSKVELQLIEDMVAEGLQLADIGEQFGLTLVQAKKWADNVEIRKAFKAGEVRAAMVDMDAKRRTRLEKRATWFIPTSVDLQCIEELSKLGWSEVKIAEQFDIDMATWQVAKGKYPVIKESVVRGQAQSEGRSIKANMRAWHPTPEDLETIKTLAGKGYTPDVIAAQMGIAVGTLEYKMQEIPEVQEAYESGFKMLEGTVVGKLMDLVNKGNVGAIIYFLKSRNKPYWSEALPKVGEKDVTPQARQVIEMPVPHKDAKAFDNESAKFRKAHKTATSD